MSILYRTRERLTVFELTRAWGLELAKGLADPEQHVRDLTRILRQDIVNGHFDNSGPLRNGERLGVGVIMSDYKIGLIDGHYLLGPVKSELMRDWCLHYVVVTKEAALDFAKHRKIPPPSWWTEGPSVSIDSDVTTTGTHLLAASPVPTPTHSATPRGRRPKKLDRVKEAMREDIRLGQLTAVALRDMTEENLAFRYHVSRDTARKARDAVLSQMPSEMAAHSNEN
jgi:hypothetical protein